MSQYEVAKRGLTGDQFLAVLAALGNPQRLRIVAALAAKRNHVSQLARDLGVSRALLYLHLRRLEDAGLVMGTLELSRKGKAMKYFELLRFRLDLGPETIVEAVATLTEGVPERQ